MSEEPTTYVFSTEDDKVVDLSNKLAELMCAFADEHKLEREEFLPLALYGVAKVHSVVLKANRSNFEQSTILFSELLAECFSEVSNPPQTH